MSKPAQPERNARIVELRKSGLKKSVIAIRMGRRFLGVELKESYFKQACLNLKAASLSGEGLFSDHVQDEVTA